YVTEVEDLDEELPVFADAFKAVMKPGTGRALFSRLSLDRSLNQLVSLIASEGEQPALMLLKAQVLGLKELEEEAEKETTESKDKTAQAPKAESKSAALLNQILQRWPNYAPAYLVYANYKFSPGYDGEPRIKALKRYAELRPMDPRPWQWMAEELKLMKRDAEAEPFYLEAAKREPNNYGRQTTLVIYYVAQNQLAKAQNSLLEAYKIAGSPDIVFADLEEQTEEVEKEESARYESLLRTQAEIIAKNKHGWHLLANMQNAQGNLAGALKSMQQTLSLEPDESDYSSIAYYHNQLKQPQAALEAAEQAIKLNEEYLPPYIQQFYAYMQLKRYTNALTTLEKIEELSPGYLAEDNFAEEDLKPIAAMPQFKALLEKSKKAAAEEQAK
ncbi:MAG TPA: hypothetical protein VEF04_05570, partial [Blastocatellia bacterium]|nr:hypothetical protein [Blastocatellia bacterium]